MNEQDLDQILDQMRQEEMPGGDAVRDRVWRNLNADGACQHFRAQFGAYRAGELDESKRMLLEDHLSRCPGCRKALHPQEAKVEVMPARRRSHVPRWAIAAGVAACALYIGRDRLDSLAAPSGVRATVREVSGAMWTANGAGLQPGAELAEGQLVRTAGGSRAVLELADGSRVEVNERTELAVFAKWSGQTVRLDRGDVIVRAAKQRRGSLHVVTQDSEVAVKGTIFTVSSGTAGSLVGVVEGSVAVKQGSSEKLLQPGERSATSVSLESVSVRQAVSWSQEKDQHFALLQELAAIQERIAPSAARTQARLLTFLPDGTRFYSAMPNLGPSIQQAVGLIEERSRQVEVLRDWWTSERSAEMRQLISHLESVSSMLGEEVVFLLASPQIPVVLAEVKPGQQAALQAKILELAPGNKRPFAFRFVNNLIVGSVDETSLNQITARLGRGANSPFAGEISRRYARGVSWIFGADMEAVPAGMIGGDKARFFGAENARFVFMEQRTVNGVEENEATLTFAGPRRGVASWLGAPGSSGSAEYITADAAFALSAATRDPKQIADEIAAFFPSFSLSGLERRIGTDITSGLIGALGNDFTLAIETPSVPIPGAIAVMEVYRPEQVTDTLRRAAEAYNAAHPDGIKVTYKTSTEGGRQWHSIDIGGEMTALHWTFDRGYWLLATSRAIAARAMQTRAGGFQLIRSAAFRSQIPTLAGAHFSGFLWMDGSSVRSIAGLERYAGTGPSLFTFSGEAERIQAASRTRIGGSLLDVLMNASPGGRTQRKITKKA